MKQQHSFHRLYFHLVLVTKQREPLIKTPEDEHFLFGCLRRKAHDLGVYIEELGSWLDHLHMLLRALPSMALSDVYRQLKGYASWAWNQRTPDLRFGWSDGVYAATVDPENNAELRTYIERQREAHASHHLVSAWEPLP